MTVKELATAMDKDVEHVFDCLSFIKTRRVVKKQTQLLDFQVINEICQKSGIRPQKIGRPTIEKKIEGWYCSMKFIFTLCSLQ